MEKSNTNSLVINLSVESNDSDIPSEAFIVKCLQSAWHSLPTHLEKNANEISVTLIDNEKMTSLNKAFFNKDKPTNVLAFPFSSLPGIPSQELGDILLCMPVIHEEAIRFSMAFLNRFSHMLVHALLHLMGYDHLEEDERATMEALEKELLSQQGFSNPYES